ncbi:MAG: DUF4166 domain-containing protein [Pseudomarimonas sp.]
MRIIVVGGYGVFGERVLRLLARDGHTLWVAGRDDGRVAAAAETLGAQALQLDRTGDLSALAQIAPDVVVDAAGPFHAYGEQPYRLVEACLEAGINYLDLCDDSDFCAGISGLDERARSRGLFALSGASSVPAISSAAVVELAKDMVHIEAIDSVILPGNRAPRGHSVIASILAQCGSEGRLWQAGRWVPMRGWSQPRSYSLEVDAKKRRRGWLVKVPDLILFPAHFVARSVSFRAGLELPVMNHFLAVLSWLRSRWRLPLRGWAVSLVESVARWLLPFGSDLGGMQVEVSGHMMRAGQLTACRRRWTLLARSGAGPWVPAIAVRALLRGPLPASGARPCIEEVSLARIESAMADLAITFRRDEAPILPLIEQLAGLAVEQLPASVRASHLVIGVMRLVGTANIERGTSLLARMTAAVCRFPPAGNHVPLEVTKQRDESGETWERNFAGRRFSSHLALNGPHISERFGPLLFTLGLYVADAALHFPVLRGTCFGIPIPLRLLPKSVAREFDIVGRFHFDVALHMPISGDLIVRYRGSLAEPPAHSTCQ